MLEPAIILTLPEREATILAGTLGIVAWIPEGDVIDALDQMNDSIDVEELPSHAETIQQFAAALMDRLDQVLSEVEDAMEA